MIINTVIKGRQKAKSKKQKERGDTDHKLLIIIIILVIEVVSIPKYTIQIMVNENQIETLADIKNKYRLKNNSAAIELIMNQWRRFIESAAQEAIKKHQHEKPQIDKRVNPQTIA